MCLRFVHGPGLMLLNLALEAGLISQLLHFINRLSGHFCFFDVIRHIIEKVGNWYI
jgi:hypothetical protein